MHLSELEQDGFRRHGMFIRRRAVPAELIEPARQLVEDWYLNHFDPHRTTEYTQKTFAPELGEHPALLALLAASPALDLAESLLGRIAPVTCAQIQIRIPETHLSTAQPIKSMHVDGVSCPHLDPAELRTFSLLVGVPLSEIADPAGGALHYLPGGHLTMAQWFADQWSLGITEQVPPAIDAHSGTPFLGQAGDVLLMHHLVPHAVGPNHTATPRIMVYFRLSHPDHASRRLHALRSPWLDYPPLKVTART